MKTIIRLISILIIFSLISINGQNENLSKIDKKLKNQIEEVIKKTGIPSISFALFDSSSVILSRAYGYSNVALKVPATISTIYHSGSTFKTITTTAIMQLSETGQINIDTPVNIYLKDDSIANPLTCNCQLTMRHLLCHQSGLSGNTQMIGLWDRKELKNLHSIAKEIMQIKEPAKEFEYCNHCYALAALALEKVTGIDFISYVSKNILEPFHIKQNPFIPSPEMVEIMAMPYKMENNKPIPENYCRFDVYPGGDTYLNPTLMASLLIPQINNGKFKNIRLLNNQSIVEMQSGQFGYKKYGLGLFLDSLDSHNIISHGGTLPGFTSYFLIDLNTKQGIYIMSNSGEIRQVLEELSKYAIRLMNGVKNIEPLPDFTKKQMVQLSESILQSYTGKYEVAPNVFAIITKEGAQLFVQITGQKKFEIYPYDITKFSLKVMDAQIEFFKDNNGQTNQLMLYQGNAKVPGRKVD
jgi:serine-type D-Ala-D-Ala carboxypeptidase/endopeptidase